MCDRPTLITQRLPELNFRNRRRLQERVTYALNAVAAIRGGLEPDILEDTCWWHTRDIKAHAAVAAAGYVRAGAQVIHRSSRRWPRSVGRRRRPSPGRGVRQRIGSDCYSGG